jgi:hypothetical protein
LALLLVCLYALMRTRWRSLVGLVSVIAVMLVVSTMLVLLRPQSVAHRGQLWTAALEVVRHPPEQLWPDGRLDERQALRPWLGYGADLQAMPLRAVMPADAAFTTDPHRAHNPLLDLWLRYGLLGVLVWGGLLASVLHNWRNTTPGWQFPLRLGLLAWVLSLGSGFPASADSLTAALLLGASLSAVQRVERLRTRSRVWGIGALRALLLLAAGLVWWMPPNTLTTVQPHGWRAPERAVLAFTQATTALQLARTAANSTLACAAGGRALDLLQQALRLDPTRREYLQASLHTQRAWCDQCAVQHPSCSR